MMASAGFAFLAALLAALPPVQATPTPPTEPRIPPVVWELTAFAESDADPVDIAEPERYTVQFLPDGQLAIRADCNSGGASYTAENGTLQISPIRTTLVGCPPDSQADPFLILLEAATTFEFDDDGMLQITGPEGSLTLRPTLTAVIWEWRELRGGDDSVIAPDHPERYTLTFLDAGKLAVRADCNRAMGTFRVDAPTLELDAAAMTRAMCPPESLSDRFLRDLADVRSHVFRDGNLYLALWADAGIMEFVAQAPEPNDATPTAG
jgi:heat shock protein HslJ